MKIKAYALFKRLKREAKKRGSSNFNINGLDISFKSGWAYPAAALPAFLAKHYDILKVYHDGKLVFAVEKNDGELLKIRTFIDGTWIERV